MRAAIYCRVSTKRQAEDGGSLADQEKACRKYIEAQDWEASVVFTDSMTGTTDQRPGLDQLRASGDFDVVVVYSTSRLARSMIDLLKLSQELPAVVSVADAFDTRENNPTGKIQRTILGLFAEIFVDQLRHSINQAQASNLEEGKWQGGMAPHGYEVTDDLYLTPDKQEAAAMRLAATLIIAHRGDTRKVADVLNEEGFTRPAGGKWFPAEVRRYLAKPALKGEVTWKGEPITVKEAVLDVATWEEAQSWLTRTSRPHVATGRSYWLSGLIDCPCGGHLVGKGQRGRRKQPQYGCNRNRPGEATACSYTFRRYWHAPQLEEEVWQSLVVWMTAAQKDESNFPYFPKLVDETTFARREDLDHLTDRIEALDDRIAEAQADIYDPDKPDATPEAVRVLQKRRRDLYEEAHQLEEELIDSVKVQNRKRLLQEADRLKQITEPDERRAVLERAGLRLALWEDGPEIWPGHTLHDWKWTK